MQALHIHSNQALIHTSMHVHSKIWGRVLMVCGDYVLPAHDLVVVDRWVVEDASFCSDQATELVVLDDSLADFL